MGPGQATEGPRQYEGWTASRFGWRLYRTFFKTYTEKVWGVPGSELKADFAAQRIKTLSLGKAIANAMMPKRARNRHDEPDRGVPVPAVRTRHDVGALPELVESGGGEVRMASPVNKMYRRPGGAYAVGYTDGSTARPSSRRGHVISSMPYSALDTGHGTAPARRGSRSGG